MKIVITKPTVYNYYTFISKLKAGSNMWFCDDGDERLGSGATSGFGVST